MTFTPEKQTEARCLQVAGRCERHAGHGDDHYTTYEEGMWTWAIEREAQGIPLIDPSDVTIGEMQKRLAVAMGCPLDGVYPDCSHGGDAWEYARHLIRDGFVIVPFGAGTPLEEGPS